MDFIGDASTKNGLYAFDIVDDINILAISRPPGDREVIIAAYTYCRTERTASSWADPLYGLDPQQTLAFKEGTGTFAGNAFNSSFLRCTTPGADVRSAHRGKQNSFLLSGAVVGTYSSTDVVRGVHKAPAGPLTGT